MKNKIFRGLILTVATTAFMLSCTLDREYLNGPNAAAFPTTKEEVEYGVFGAYKALTLIDAASTPFPGIQDNASDIGASRIAIANFNNQQQSKVAIDNAWVKKVYENIYKTAARANLILDGMAKLNLEGPEAIMTETEYNMYKAEAMVVRSYVYDWGCQMFGDIAYLDHTLGLDDTYTRMPREEVIANILADLDDDLLDYLPLRHDKNKYGSARMGRIGAYGLKARICLNWGMYEEAAKYADKAIKLSEENGVYALETYNTAYCGSDHTQGEPSATNLFGISGHKNSDEWIWALQFNTAISSNQHNAGYYAAPRIAGGCSYLSPTQAFIDAFQCRDGKSIVESNSYDYTKPWQNRDPRLDLFCVRPGSRVLGFQFDTTPTVQQIMNYNEGIMVTNSEAYGSKSEYGANGTKGPCGYLWRKYLDIAEYHANGNSFGTSSVCVLNYPLMRLSELYLIRAEALIESNTDLATAKADIEKIRARAGMPGLESASQSALRSALRYERMVELCNEGFRWFDIRRWGIASTVISGTLYAPALNGAVSNAKPTIDANWCVTYPGDTFDGKAMNLRTFLEMAYDVNKDNLWPIPEAERTGNPLILQNPGYAGYVD